MKMNICFALLVGVFSVACTPWPPYSNEAQKHFKEHREQLEKLRQNFENTGFAQVGISAVREGLVGRKTFDDVPKPVQVPNEKIIKNGLTELEIPEISRKDDTTYFVLNRKEMDGSTYAWFYAVSSDQKSKPPVCKQSLKQNPCGKCSFLLDNKWWVEYNWRPSDLTIAKQKCAGEFR